MYQTATNPETGEKVALIDGRWVPITQTASNPETGERVGLVGNQWVPVGRVEAPTPAAAAPTAKTPSIDDTNILRDVPGALVSGLGQLAKFPTNLYGLATGDFDTMASRAAQGLTDIGEDIKSEGLRERERLAQERIAAQEGFLGEAGQTIKEYATDPRLLMSGALSSLPSMVGGLGVGALAGKGVGKLAARKAAEEVAKAKGRKAAVVGGIGAAAAEQGASVGEDTYSRVTALPEEILTQSPDYQSLLEAGATPEDARQELALSAARKASTAATALSAVSAGLLPRAIEKTVFGDAVTDGIIKRSLKSFAGEATQEGIEEGGGQLAQNLAVSQADVTADPFKGVGAATAQGAILGGAFGAPIGALSGRAQAAAPDQEAPPVAPEVQAEFQKLAAQQVAAAMAANPDISQDEATTVVVARADVILEQAKANVEAAQTQAGAGLDGGAGRPDVDVAGAAGPSVPVTGAPTPTGEDTQTVPQTKPVRVAGAGKPVGGPTGAEAGADGTLTPITGKQVTATIPAIEQAFDDNALDFEVYGVEKLNAEQKKQAARIVLQSPEVAPYDAIVSVLDRGLQAEQVPSKTTIDINGQKRTIETAPTLAGAQQLAAELGVTKERYPALEAAYALPKDKTAEKMRIIAPVVADIFTRVTGLSTSKLPEGDTKKAYSSSNTRILNAVLREEAVNPETIVQEQLTQYKVPLPETAAPTQAAPTQAAPTPVAEEIAPAPEPEPTPQQIAKNLIYFSGPEARSRGYTPNTAPYGMFAEGVRDVALGLEPIPDQRVLENSGQEGLDAYKAGLQWAQGSVAAAQAPAAKAAPKKAAPTPVEAPLPEAYAPILQDYQAIAEKPTPEAMDQLKASTVRDIPTQDTNMTMSVVPAPDGTLLALPGPNMVRNWQRSIQGESGQILRSQTIDQFYDYEGFEAPLQVTRPAVVDASGNVVQRGVLGKAPTAKAAPKKAKAAPKGPVFENIAQPNTPEAAALVEEPRNTDIVALAEELPEADRVNVRARLDRITENYAKDGDVERLLGSLEELRKDVYRRIYRNQAKRGRPRVRGFERAMEVIYRAERNGQLSPSAAGLVRWLLERNPAIAEELAISFRAGNEQSPAGQYNPIVRLATIFTSGANDSTAVHEVLHHTERLMPEAVRDGIRAAWMKRVQDLIAYADRTNNAEMRRVLSAIVQAYYGNQEAQRVLSEAFAAGNIPYSVYHLSNPSEFWAVNASELLSDRASRTGWVGAARNWLRDFIETVKDFFGLTNNAAVIRGLRSVLAAESGAMTGEMLASATSEFLAPAGGPKKPVNNATVNKVAAAKLTKAQIKRLEEAAGVRRMKITGMQKRILRSRSAEETTSLMGKLMLIARNPSEDGNILISLFNSVSGPSALQKLLGPQMTEDVVRLANAFGLKNVQRIDDLMRNEYIPYVNRMVLNASQTSEKLADFLSRTELGGKALTDVVIYANMVDVDPSLAPNATEYFKLDNKLAELKAELASETDPKKRTAIQNNISTRQGEISRTYTGGVDEQTKETVYGWNDLSRPEFGGGAGKLMFRMLRDEYRKTFDEHYRLLMARINAADIKSEDRIKLKSAVEKMFAEAKKRTIYFPLKRFGEYWVTVGKGKTGEFHMFESLTAQEAFMAQLREDKDTRDVSSGFGRDTLRKELTKNDASAALKNILDLIADGKAADVDVLEESVLQLYLTALPESDMRRRFIHRSFKTGFSTDLLRTYASTSIASANQLGRLAFNYKFDNLITAGLKETEGRPSKAKLDTITREMALRVKGMLSPNPQNDVDWWLSLGAKSTFYLLLSAPKSAFVNLLQLPIVGTPTLSAEFGEAATTATMARYMGTFLTGKRIGSPFKDKDGNLKLQTPKFTLENSPYIQELRKTDPARYGELMKAWRFFEERDVTQSTFTASANIYERSNKPSDKFSFTQSLRRGDTASAAQLAVANTGQLLGASFHTFERIGREIMVMSAFDMAYERAIKQGKTPKDAGKEARELAEKLTNKAMFDFSNWNKSRYAKSRAGRLPLQMRSYSQSMTSLLLRSLVSMLPLQRNKGGKLAAARMFFGVAAMTSLFGGLRASWLYMWALGAYGIYEFVKETFGDDDDEEEKEIEGGYVSEETIQREMLKFADGKGRELSKKDMEYHIRSVWIPETFGPGGTMQKALGLSDEAAAKLAAMADMGLPALGGVDISSSVSLNDLWHSTPAKSDDPEVMFLETLGRTILGPSAALVAVPFRIVKEANAGNMDKAVEAAMPAALKNVFKAARLEEEGLVVGKNRDVVLKDPSFYDVYTLAMQSLGFTEAGTSRAMQLDIKAGEIEEEVGKQATELLDQRYRAVLEFNKKPTDENLKNWKRVERDITVYNLNYPSNTITEEDKDKSFQSKSKVAGERAYGLGFNPKIPVRQPLAEQRANEMLRDK
jgi:hypothetical protein